MTSSKGSAGRFIAFLVIVAAICGYLSWKWGAFNRQTIGSAGQPVATAPGPSGAGSTGAATAETAAASGSSSQGASSSQSAAGAVPPSSGAAGSASASASVHAPAPRGSASEPSMATATTASVAGSNRGAGPTAPAARTGTVPPAAGATVTGGGGTSTAPAASRASAFASARLDQERAQSEAIDLLRSVIDDPQAPVAARDQAAGRLTAMADQVRSEARAATLLKAKGYRDALVFLEPHGATAIVDAPVLHATDAARIAETVAQATGVAATEVNVLAEQ